MFCFERTNTIKKASPYLRVRLVFLLDSRMGLLIFFSLRVNRGNLETPVVWMLPPVIVVGPAIAFLTFLDVPSKNIFISLCIYSCNTNIEFYFSLTMTLTIFSCTQKNIYILFFLHPTPIQKIKTIIAIYTYL